MSEVTSPIILDTTGQDIVAKLQDVIDAINGGTIDPLTVNQNGTYTPSGTTLGYGPVTVNVQGGGGIPLLTRAEWNALTIAQKKAYGLLAIQDANSGFDRGELVYGADYIPIPEYLPYSAVTDISCFARYENFNPSLSSWGEGSTPIIMSSTVTRYQSEDAVYLDSLTGSKKFSVALAGKQSDFTCYCVAKGISYAPGDVIIMGSVDSWFYGGLVMLYHQSGTMWRTSVYDSDTDLVNPNGGYTAVAIKCSDNLYSFYAYGGTNRLGVPGDRTHPSWRTNTHADEFTFGSWGTGNYSTDLAVKFVGMSTVAESDSNIVANLNNLASVFGLS